MADPHTLAPALTVRNAHSNEGLVIAKKHFARHLLFLEARLGISNTSQVDSLLGRMRNLSAFDLGSFESREQATQAVNIWNAIINGNLEVPLTLSTLAPIAYSYIRIMSDLSLGDISFPSAEILANLPAAQPYGMAFNEKLAPSPIRSHSLWYEDASYLFKRVLAARPGLLMEERDLRLRELGLDPQKGDLDGRLKAVQIVIARKIAEASEASGSGKIAAAGFFALPLVAYIYDAHAAVALFLSTFSLLAVRFVQRHLRIRGLNAELRQLDQHVDCIGRISDGFEE
ncbi:hypothetical protein HY988_01960 [Candidatus Micrarchaeota archaeon]|nr:hypothetical protein [Candidatus Micrarchaeota archaeon]